MAVSLPSEKGEEGGGGLLMRRFLKEEVEADAVEIDGDDGVREAPRDLTGAPPPLLPPPSMNLFSRREGM